MAPVKGKLGVPAVQADSPFLEPVPERFGLRLKVEARKSSGEAVPTPRNESEWLIRLEFQDANAEWWHRAYQVPSLGGAGPYVEIDRLSKGRAPLEYWK